MVKKPTTLDFTVHRFMRFILIRKYGNCFQNLQ